jgi:hypothetical protein
MDISKSLTRADYEGVFVSSEPNTWLYAVTAVYTPDRVLNVPMSVLERIGESTWHKSSPGFVSVEDILEDVPLTDAEMAAMYPEMAMYDPDRGMEWYRPEPVDVGAYVEPQYFGDGSDIPDDEAEGGSGSEDDDEDEDGGETGDDEGGTE